MAGSLDLVDFASLTSAKIAAGCESAMRGCDAAVDAIVAIPDAYRTFANTMLALEEAADVLGSAQGQLGFMAYVTADDELRASAREWDEKLDKYGIALSFREDLYAAVRAFALLPEASGLTGEDARLLQFELRDYRRNGFELPADERAKVRELLDKLVELDVQFRKAIDEWDDGITVRREDLAALPESFIENLKTVDVDGETRFRVSLDYPEIQPFMANAQSSDLRRQLFEKDQRKGGPGNVRVLEEAIAVRAEVAQRLGYDSWAAYRTETRMAKRRENVEVFLADLREKVALKAARDLAETRALAAERTGSAEVNIWDWRYWNNELLKSRYAVNEFEVAQYFPLDACIAGLFKVTQSMLGVRYEPAPSAPRWHADVQAFDIFETDGSEPFARFYMDLFPRPNKYGHAAAFTLRRARMLPDGDYQRPVSAIVANFTKPSATQPSLLRHSEVVTFFHEFGHILHQTLTRARRA
ncbi:MAG: M3 family metallopeptidase, partial [Anaerolineaceae bacterium]